MALPSGTLLIDARNAGARLPRELSLVTPLIVDRDIELIVIDDTQDVRVTRIARRYKARHVRLCVLPLGERLNTTIAGTRGSVLVFPLLGCIGSTRTLLQLVRRIGAGEVDAVTLSGSPPGLLARLLKRHKPAPVVGICMSRQWYERLGGCDPQLDHDALDDLVERLRHCGARLECITPVHQAG
ncbi:MULTISPECIES: glycosyltransferase family A protein [Halomonas]|uniref:Glycosyltransferase n=2 Tax=Halomonas TaxID=2745 RepID=A0A7X4VYE7_9GAMM|nr:MULTISPECIES: glycosyltransferase family A protein [Halomonas]MDR5902648.1 glycosyltransferase family A protein [Halomonas icarae]NAW12506.1 hypothetical protein [Halomonas icarae]TDB04617.1 glycosyltransferase family 2 protein [Halomonas marinisediminis]